MKIVFQCECGTRMQASPEHAGQRTRCPSCQREVMIPRDPDQPAPVTEPEPVFLAEAVTPADDYVEERERRPRRPVQPKTSGLAVASMVLGLTSVVLSVLTGIPAIILGIIGLVQIRSSKGELCGKGYAIAGIVLGTVLSLAVIPMFFAIQRVREAATRMLSGSNMRQIGIAMHNYHNDHNVFPPAAIVDRNGKPLLSWRVAILPQLGEHELYNQVKLDEPWDSPNNKRLLDRMPKVYAPPGEKGGSVTYYQVFVGGDSVFSGQGRVTLRQIENLAGTSNVILLAEAGEPVPWTKPEDIRIEPNRPIPPLGGLSTGKHFHVLKCDGAIVQIRKDCDQQELRRALNWKTPNPANWEKLQGK